MNAATLQQDPKRSNPGKCLADGVANHPLVAQHLFYTLPGDLLRHLRALGLTLHLCDPDLYHVEDAMTDAMARYPNAVGTWNCAPVSYRFLAPSPPVSSLKGTILSLFKDDPAWQPIINDLDRNLAAADSRLGALHQGTLGYCGWLLVNAQFVKEHDQFFTRWRAQVLKYGLPIRGPLPQGIEKWIDSIEAPNAETIKYAQGYGQLLDRWELADLRAPYLPEPREIQVPVLLPHQANHLTRGGGQLIYLPSNVPVPDRDTARDMMAGAVGAQAAPAHLQEWRKIVHATNTAKNRIPHYARLFRLQHYWLVLHKRWDKHLKRRNEKLQIAFAAWLMPNDDNPEKGLDTIRKDLYFIAKHRGAADWCLTPNALDLF